MDIQDWRLRKLHNHWLDRKGERRFPRRADLDPVDISYILGRLMLVEVSHDPLRFHVRLHGCDLVDFAHYELTGKALDELPIPEYRDYVIKQCKGIVAAGEPLHVRHSRLLDGRRRRYEAVWLPLSENGSDVSMLICGLIYEKDAPVHGAGVAGLARAAARRDA